MELSELVVFHDDVLTVCDKTGIVFKGSLVCFRIKVITYFILCQVDLYPLVDYASKLLNTNGPKVHQAKESLSPYVILADGNGLEKKGFKGEWMTVKVSCN